MPIQTAKEVKPKTLSKSSMLIFGRNRVGKSSIASQIPRACFIATEPGLSMIGVDRWADEKGNYVVKDWETLEAAINEVGMSGNYDTIVIDTIDNAVHLCFEYVCKKYKVEHYNDGKIGFGKGKEIINNKLRHHVKDLSMKGVGICFISHAKEEIEKKPTGDVQRFVPNLPKEIRFVLLGCIDFIFYMKEGIDSTGKKSRYILTKATENSDGGCRAPVKDQIVFTEEETMWATLEKECNEAIKIKVAKSKK